MELRRLLYGEEAALLEAIRRDWSPTGKRDYTLFLLLVRTGLTSGLAAFAVGE